MTDKISIIEVGPRDGLQNIKTLLSLEQKKTLIQNLLDCGFQHIEAGSFVRPDKVPSMADTPQLAGHFKKQKNRLWYLVPNTKGLQTALGHQVTQLAFFTAASRTFNQKNIGMPTEQSLKTIRESIQFLKEEGYSFIKNWNQKPKKAKEIKLRLYISTVIACPYEGKMDPKAASTIMDALFPLGFAQISLGDTIGAGKPEDWKIFFQALDSHYFSQDKLAMHCHDTTGTALSCVQEGLLRGIRSFDSSIGGLGGCPFAPGAPGNLSTESLTQFLEKEGFKTGIDLQKLREIKLPI